MRKMKAALNQDFSTVRMPKQFIQNAQTQNTASRTCQWGLSRYRARVTRTRCHFSQDLVS